MKHLLLSFQSSPFQLHHKRDSGRWNVAL